MAKAFYGLENFLSKIRAEHTPRTDRFEVEFFLPQGRTGLSALAPLNALQVVTLYCEEAQIPGYSATNIPIKVGAWTEYRNNNLEFLTTDLAFTFLVDEKWTGRSFFERWIELTADPVSKEVAFYNEIVADLKIKSLDMQDNVMAQWHIYEAMPKLINISPLSWGNVGLMRMQVSMAAKYWKREI